MLPSQSNIFSSHNIRMGVGVWSWGDKLMWGYGREYSDEDLLQVFLKCLDCGLIFFDTAEVYGQGRSETILGEFLAHARRNVVIATKFMPYPWRLSRKDLIKALGKSLTRMNLAYVDLYQIHTPLPPVPLTTWSEALVEALESGLTKAVGLSNCDLRQMTQVQEVLQKHGLSLMSNQMEFNLVNRGVEKEGLLAACAGMGIQLIAYSPLVMGMLGGRYSSQNPPQGIRGRRFSRAYLDKIAPLLGQMARIAANHDGRPLSQVALNWIISKGAIPIPGGHSTSQVEENSRTLEWDLSEDEVNSLDEISDRVNQAG